MRGKAEPGREETSAEQQEIAPQRSTSVVPPSPTMPSSGNVAFPRGSPTSRGVIRSTWNEDKTPVTQAPTAQVETPTSSEFPSGEPGSVRLPLGGGDLRRLSGVRVGLVDVDPTRTDAVAVALRARGAEVHVSSLTGGRAHFRLLRRFAPHALLIEEAVMATQAQPFVNQLRQDPFLAATQILPVRLERLFRRRSGVASIESILGMLEPLGRPEMELLSRLGPHLEVEFDLDQFPPHRLLRMLANRTEPTTLTCTREKEMFRWTMSHGKMGRAELWRSGSPFPQRLNVDRALDWLLSHNNCHVVLSQPTEFDDSTAKAVVPLVESQESGLWTLPNTPATGALAAQLAKESASLLPVEVESPTVVQRMPSTPLGRQSTTRSWWGWGAVASCTLGVASAWLLLPRADAPVETTVSAVVPATQEKEAPQHNSGEGSRRASVNHEPQPAPTQSVAEVGSDSTDDDALARFFRHPEQPGPPCEDLVGTWSAPQQGTAALSDQHWRFAQRQLVQGKNDEAHLSLCRSALLNGAGSGSEQLASFSLAQGDLTQAERWISQLLQGNPHSHSVQELYGDLLHQRGQRKEAMQVWLETIGVDASNQSKRNAVARVWLKHAQTALGVSDYPRAERDLRRAFELAPANRDVHLAFARLLRRQGEIQRIDEWLQLVAAQN